MIDSGTAWINGGNKKPTLDFVLLPREYTIGELSAIFSRVNQGAHEVFQDIMNGTVPKTI